MEGGHRPNAANHGRFARSMDRDDIEEGSSSRCRITGAAGEDLVEKQNAEQGLMPIVGHEAEEYGYEAENRHFVQCFLEGKQPELTFDDGLEVVELLMTAYMSAEPGRTLPFRPEGLEKFIPAVARGKWKP